MTYSEIIALTEKGFTPDQIMILAGGSAPADPPAADPPAADPVTGQDLTSLMASVKSMGDQIAALTKAYQERNIKEIIAEKIPPSESADDILAGLIHPPLDDKSNIGGKTK